MLDNENDIEILDLTIRSENILRAEGINTIEELINDSFSQIMKELNELRTLILENNYQINEIIKIRV